MNECKIRNKTYAKVSRDRKKLYIKTLEKTLMQKELQIEELETKYNNLQKLIATEITSPPILELPRLKINELMTQFNPKNSVESIKNFISKRNTLINEELDYLIEKMFETILPFSYRLLIVCIKESLSIFKDSNKKHFKEFNNPNSEISLLMDNLCEKAGLNQEDKSCLNSKSQKIFNQYNNIFDKFIHIVDSKNTLSQEINGLNTAFFEEIFKFLPIDSSFKILTEDPCVNIIRIKRLILS